MTRQPEASSGGWANRRFDSFTSQTLSRRISRELLKGILQGEIGPEESLPSEDELARQFDVSRPVIREAVKELAVLGVVSSRQGRSTRVTPSESWNHFAPELLAARYEVGAVDDILLELLELRRLIEVEAAAIAATRASDADIAALERILRGMDDSLTDLSHFTDADVEFHRTLLAATGNRLLTRLIDLIGPLLRFGREVSVARRPNGPADSQLGHRAVFDAVVSHDPEAARAAMREHLSWTADLDFADRELRMVTPQRPS